MAGFVSPAGRGRAARPLADCAVAAARMRPRPRTFAGVDAWFDNLVPGAGLPFDAFTAVLLLLCLGLWRSLPAFLWTENLVSAAVMMMMGMGLALLYFVYLRNSGCGKSKSNCPTWWTWCAHCVRAGGSLDQADCRGG